MFYSKLRIKIFLGNKNFFVTSRGRFKANFELKIFFGQKRNFFGLNSSHIYKNYRI